MHDSFFAIFASLWLALSNEKEWKIRNPTQLLTSLFLFQRQVENKRKTNERNAKKAIK